LIIGAVCTGLLAVGLGVPAFATQNPDPSPGTATPDIIGGHAPSQPYPGMGSLQVYRGADDPLHHTCGAALVSGLFLVTAAHCVTDPDTSAPMAAGLFHVRVGSANRTSGGVLAGVSQILVNANWAWPNVGPGIVGDVALLKLDSYIQGYQWFEVAPKLQPRRTLRLLGWGVTEPNGDKPLPEMLQELDTRILPSAHCPADYLIGADQLCVDDPNGTDGACRGDSGGPALQTVAGSNPLRWAVIGGTFGGPHDCGTTPFIYTDWSYWRPWMYQVMRTGIVPPRTDGGPGRTGGAPTRSGAPAAAANTASGTYQADWHADCLQSQTIRACAQ
jgi:secreted trypsin-like serine protease